MKANKPLQLERATFLLDHAQIIKLKHVAVDEGASASDVVRRAIDKDLGERESLAGSAGAEKK